MAGELAFEPRSRVRPVAFDCPHGESEVFGDFRAGHTREKSKDDDLGSTRIDRLETCERSLEGEKVFDRHGTRGGRLQEIVELHRLSAAAALVTLLMPAVVDEQPAHRLRAKGEAMGPSLPVDAAIVSQPQPGLVDERRRLKRVIPPLAPEISARHVPQLAVNHGK